MWHSPGRLTYSNTAHDYVALHIVQHKHETHHTAVSYGSLQID